MDRERGELRESLAALGLLLLCLSVMRLTFLAEERIACVAVYREHLLTTNPELLLDWLRVGWFPILAAAFGLGVAVFAWLRLRPTEAGDRSPGLEGAPSIPASRP